MGGDIQNRFAKGEKDRSSIKGAGGNIIQISKRSIQRPAAPYGLMKETSSILYPVSDCNVKLRNLKSNAVPDPEFIELLKQMEGYITDPGPLSPSNLL